MVDQHTSTDCGMRAAKLPFTGSRCSTLRGLAHDGQRAMGRILIEPGRCLRSNCSVRSDRPPQLCGGSPPPKLSTRRTTIAATGPITLPSVPCRVLKASRPSAEHDAPSVCLTADGVAASENHGSDRRRPLGAETSTTTMAIVLRCSGSSVSSSSCRSLLGESGRAPTGGALLRSSGPNHRTR